MDAETSLRVLLTTDTVGGVWHYSIDLAGALQRRGVQVVLATMGAPLTPPQRDQVSRLRLPALRDSSFKLEWMQDAWADVDRAGDWLLALEREFAPDLVHLNQFAFGALPFAAPTLLVAHSCVLSWWLAVHGVPAPAEWDEYRRRVARGLAGATAVAAPTRAMLDSLAPNHGFAGEGLVLPNGRDPDRFRPAAKEPFVLAAGRLWDAAKNLAALEAVAPRLPWPVRIAGSMSHPGKAPSPLPSPASGRGRGSLPLQGWGEGHVPSQIEFLGELPDHSLTRQLAAASIYALPARYEPFGLSVLEAALSGCALVLGDIASLREIWGPAALYVPPDDHAALEATLRRLAGDTAGRARLGIAARSRALRFTSHRMTEAYLAAYASLQPAFAATNREILCV